jgi:hypothetical protein
MEGVRKLARSGSVRMEEMFSSKNRQNGKEVEDDDTDAPTRLTILRSFNTKRKVETKKEKEFNNSFNGKMFVIKM